MKRLFKRIVEKIRWKQTIVNFARPVNISNHYSKGQSLQQMQFIARI